MKGWCAEGDVHSFSTITLGSILLEPLFQQLQIHFLCLRPFPLWKALCTNCGKEATSREVRCQLLPTESCRVHLE